MPKILSVTTPHHHEPLQYLAAPARLGSSPSLFPHNHSAGKMQHHDDSPTSPTTTNAATRTAAAVRASPLHRGEACLTCRRRKMKCDAAKPHCGPCSRAGKADECEYEETRFLAQINRLEDENAALRARVDELERSTSNPSTSSFLPAQPFPAFMPGPGRRSPSDSSSGGQPSPYGQPTPLLVPHHHQQQQHPLSPYPQAHHGHYDHQALPSIVTQPAPAVQQQQEWAASSPGGGGGGLALQDPIAPHILQRLMQIFTRVASTQFSLPSTSIALLASRRGSGALQEAACAAACVFARPNNGMGAWEGMFAQRASLALARTSEPSLQDLQAQGILAVLAFVGGRAMEGQRHLGGALRVARALGLHHPDTQAQDGEGRETWWMLYRAERAWAPVVGDLGDASGAPGHGVELVKQEYDYTSSSPYGVDVSVGMGAGAGAMACKGAQLAARAWGLVGDNPNSNPAFWPDVHSTTSSLERLLSTSLSPSTALVSAAALCVLHSAVSAREQARGAAGRVVGLLSAGGGAGGGGGGGGEGVEGMDAVVGWWISRVLSTARRDALLDVGALGVLERAFERAAGVWGYVGALRI